MTKRNPLEKDVKHEIKKVLEKHGWFWWMTPQNGYGKSGVADIIAFKRGVMVAIEAKLDGKKPTEIQKAFLNSIRQDDGFAFVVDGERVAWLDGWCSAFERATQAAIKEKKPSPEDGAYMLNAIKEMTRDL